MCVCIFSCQKFLVFFLYLLFSKYIFALIFQSFSSQQAFQNMHPKLPKTYLRKQPKAEIVIFKFNPIDVDLNKVVAPVLKLH